MIHGKLLPFEFIDCALKLAMGCVLVENWLPDGKDYDFQPSLHWGANSDVMRILDPEMDLKNGFRRWLLALDGLPESHGAVGINVCDHA